MPFHFKQNEDIASGVRRILTEQCGTIREGLSSATSADCDEPIHAARKCCKRLRALLRLIRPAIGKERYKQHNRFLRDLARRIAGPRDAFVILRTWNRLVNSWKSESPVEDAELPAAIRSILSRRYSISKQETVEHEDQLERVAADIAGFQSRLHELPLDKLTWPNLAKGLRKQYKRNLKAMTAAEKTPTFETYHEWRKKVKYLWHQIELFVPCQEDALSPVARKLHKLSDCLGEDHDLAVLLNVLETEAAPKVDPADLAAIRSDIERRQARLRKKARKLGGGLYEDTPGKFVERIENLSFAGTAASFPAGQPDIRGEM